MKNMKKLLSLLLCLAMVISVAACGDTKDNGKNSEANKSSQVAESTGGAEESSSVEEERETITLTTLTSTNVDAFPWFLDYVEEEFGIILESKMDTGNEVLQSLLTSGELTDIVVLLTQDSIKAAVDGGMLLDLDQYADLMPDVMASETYAPGMAKIRDTYGWLAGLPCTVGTNRGMEGNTIIRWDLYEEIGSPEVNSWDEWLEMLAEMKKTEEGKNMVGLGIWSDWDGKSMYAARAYYMWCMGYGDNISPMTEFFWDGSKGDPTSLLADNSIYYQGLKYLWKANQMGLIDPDAVSVKWANVYEQMCSGTLLSFYADWSDVWGDENAEDYTGYGVLYHDERLGVFTADAALGENGRLMGISSKCEYPERAVEFLNWWYSDEGVSMIVNGPENVVWEWKDGQRVYTQEYIEAYNKGEEFILPGGGTKNPYMIYNVVPVTLTNPDPSGDGCVDISRNPGAYGTIEQTKLDAAWSAAHDGQPDIYSYRQSIRNDQNAIEVTPVLSLVPAAPDEITQIVNQIGPEVVTASWEMVYAETEEEFDKIWKQLQKDAEDIGIDQVVEDAVNRYHQALDLAEKYGLDV